MRSIWAVAVNTLKQALRMKIAAAFVLMLVVLVPVMGLTMTGDGTLVGRLQSFVSYSLSLTAFLLALLTVVVSIYSISSDILQKQIFTVLTKPIRRSQLLVGKFLGVILLDGILLGLFAVLIYVTVLNMPKFLNSPGHERERAKNEFFTARASLSPPQIDVSKEVEEAYRKLDKEGQLAQLLERMPRESIVAELTKHKSLEKRAVVPGREIRWEFENVRPLDSSQTLFVRYKHDVSVNPPDLKVNGKWFVGDSENYKGYTFDRTDAVRTFHEFDVPADAVGADGLLTVAFFNDPRVNNTVIIFPLAGGLEVMYTADSFGANFIRAVLLIFCRLVFLGALGILSATFLSFPVAVLLCMLVFLTGNVSGFVIESFDYLSENVGWFYSLTVRPLIKLLPQFDKANPTKYLVQARLLRWSSLARIAAVMICIKSLLLMLLALLIFSRREIAKITV